ncbi:MAG: branched-chain amino acid ABC transporter permease [Proteobacteria bacterium]|nr:branched-chain amino acid ABC transporter permease [Pseudomonadota bacterium]
MTEVLQLLIYGIVLGSIITLGAVGLSLIYGIVRFANFAHGDMMTAGAYFAFFFVVTLELPMFVGFPLAMAGGALLAVALDRVLFRRLRRTSPVVLLISSFGVALMLRAAIQLVWGPSVQVYEAGIEFPIRFLGLGIKPDQLHILGGSVVIVVALHLFLQRSRTGKAMRAMSDNVALARVSGIDTERVILWTWVIGAALTAAAGVFLAIDTQLHPVMGWRLLLPVFAAAILGGIGKPYGALAGGMVIGIAQEMSTLVISPGYKPAIAFAIMVVMLILRPAGLLGARR